MRWVGWAPEHDSWEDEANIHDPELIQEFKRKRDLRKKRLKALGAPPPMEMNAVCLTVLGIVGRSLTIPQLRQQVRKQFPETVGIMERGTIRAAVDELSSAGAIHERVRRSDSVAVYTLTTAFNRIKCAMALKKGLSDQLVRESVEACYLVVYDSWLRLQKNPNAGKYAAPKHAAGRPPQIDFTDVPLPPIESFGTRRRPNHACYHSIRLRLKGWADNVWNQADADEPEEADGPEEADEEADGPEDADEEREASNSASENAALTTGVGAPEASEQAGAPQLAVTIDAAGESPPTGPVGMAAVATQAEVAAAGNAASEDQATLAPVCKPMSQSATHVPTLAGRSPGLHWFESFAEPNETEVLFYAILAIRILGAEELGMWASKVLLERSVAEEKQARWQPLPHWGMYGHTSKVFKPLDVAFRSIWTREQLAAMALTIQQWDGPGACARIRGEHLRTYIQRRPQAPKSGKSTASLRWRSWTVIWVADLIQRCGDSLRRSLEAAEAEIHVETNAKTVAKAAAKNEAKVKLAERAKAQVEVQVLQKREARQRRARQNIVYSQGAPVRSDICLAFQIGSCRNGSSCRWRHVFDHPLSVDCNGSSGTEIKARAATAKANAAVALSAAPPSPIGIRQAMWHWVHE